MPGYTPVASRTSGSAPPTPGQYVPVAQRVAQASAPAPTAKPSFFDNIKSFFGGSSTPTPTPSAPVSDSPLYVPVAERASTASTVGSQGGNTPAPVAPSGPPTYVPVGQRTSSPVVPSAPPAPSFMDKVSSGLDKASGVISDAIAPPTTLPDGGKNATKNTLAYLPSEIVRHLPFGIGSIFQQIQDDPATAARLGLKDVTESAPAAIGSQVQEYAKAPIQGALDIAGASVAPLTQGKYNGEISFHIPGLGEVSNAQFRAASRVAQGEDPVQVALEEGAGSIFETLFFADVASRPFLGRATKTAEFQTGTGRTVDTNTLPSKTGPQIVSEMPAGPKDIGPKSFRLYEKPVVQQPLPPSMVARMEQQGINLGENFDPNLPTYFRVSPGAKDTVVGEIMQVKPSLFSNLVNVFKPKGPGVGDTAAHIAMSEGMNIDKAIAAGDIPSSAVYKDQSTGVLTPQYAEGRITDVAQKLENYEPGLGAEFRKSVDVNNATMKGLEEAGLKVLDNAVADGTVALPGPVTPEVGGAVKPTIPREDVHVLYTRNVDNKLASEAGASPVVKPPQPQTPSTPEEAVQTYYENVVKPAQDKGEATVIGADNMKDYFGGDYNDANHHIYSKASFQLYERALKENPGDVVLVGGGPGSGKTEVLVQELLKAGYNGIIYDSNLSNLEGAKKQIQMAEDAGKAVDIYGITPHLDSARGFTIQRAGVTGRAIKDNTFARGHAGFPNVVADLIDQGIIPENKVHIIDYSKGNISLQQAKQSFADNNFVASPLAHLRNLGYTEDYVRQHHAENLYEQGTGRKIKQSGGESIDGGSSRKSPGENSIPEQSSTRANTRRKSSSGLSEQVQGLIEKYTQKAVSSSDSIVESPLSKYAGDLAKERANAEASKAEPGTYFFVQSLMQYQEETIAKYEPLVANVLGELSDSAEAKKDWEDHYATDYQTLSDALVRLEKEIKDLPAKEKVKKSELKSQSADISKAMADMEASFINEWRNKAEQMVLDGVKNVTAEVVKTNLAEKRNSAPTIDFSKGDVVIATSKATGKSVEREVSSTKEAGLALIEPVSGLPMSYPSEKWTFELKGKVKPRAKGPGINSSEMIAMENTPTGSIPASQTPEEYLRTQMGDVFDVVSPIGDLWKAKGDTIFIKPKRANAGFVSSLRQKNFIVSAQEAGGNDVVKVTVKMPAPKKILTEKNLTLETRPVPGGRDTSMKAPDVKKLLAKGGEFAKDPTLTVEMKDGQKMLSFKGETTSFFIKPGALGLVTDNLKVGDRIGVSKALLDGSVKETGMNVIQHKGGSSSVYANIGDFRDGTPIRAGGMDHVNPVELPELVDIARELLQGKVPKILQKMGQKRGHFNPGKGEIALRADFFNDPVQVAKTLAHELGHLIDYLPDMVSSRGNLLGRLFTLKRFLKSTFDKEAGAGVALDKLRKKALTDVLAENNKTFGDYMTDKALREDIKPAVKERYQQLVDATHAIKNEVIKNELVSASDYWRPWDRTQATSSFISYRNSSSELYADAISMLFNSPGLLEEMAPTFYKEFFDALDKKPEVRDAYFSLQSLLGGDRELLIKARREGVQKMFKEGDLKAYELQRQRLAEKKERNGNIVQRLKHELVDKNNSIIQRVQELEKAGKPVNPDDNPIYFLEERNYIGGKLKYVAEDFNSIYQDVQKAGITWDQFGEALFYERISAGDRSEQANPRGITPSAANELLDTMKSEMSPEQWTQLQANIAQFRHVMRGITDEAFQEGLYTPELHKQMQENEAYVSFQVLDHLDTEVSHKVFKSIGTFKDIANPADATILKTMATIRAIERNKVHRATVDFLQTNFPGDTREADKRWSGKAMTYVESKDAKEELVFVYRDGKPVGYYVDPYVAKSLRNESVGHNLAVLTGFRFMNSNIFRPLFIAFSPGFQAFNAIRDFKRFYKNVPDMTLARAVQRYYEALPMAKIRAFGLPENGSPAQVQAYNDLRELEKNKVFGFTFNDILDGMPDDEKQIERVMRQSGIESFQTLKPGLIQKVPKWMLDFLELIKKTGDLVETLPKAAGFYEIKAKGGVLGPEERSYIRKYLGSPDFLAGGALKPMTNEVFLFSNAIIQGIRSDIVMATSPKTRSGYWWKTAKIDILPKLLMLAAAAGFFGKELKDMMDSASEYDKTNYLVLPLGHDSTGKTIYMRMPQDETGRLIGGLAWKIATAPTNTQPIGTDLADLASFFAGQLPNVSPAITGAVAGTQYASGVNPYDFFRGRNVISQDVFNAGGWRSLKSFLGWEFQTLGGGVFVKFYNEPTAPKTSGTVEHFMGLPIISNVLGRFIRTTDYGKTEELKGIQQQAVRQEANQRLSDNDIVNGALQKALQDPNIGANRGTYEAALRLQIKGDGPMDQSAQDRFDRARARFRLGLVKGSADAQTTALIGATTNNEKAQILQQIKSDMQDSDFQQYVSELRRNNIVTPDVINKLNKLTP